MARTKHFLSFFFPPSRGGEIPCGEWSEQRSAEDEEKEKRKERAKERKGEKAKPFGRRAICYATDGDAVKLGKPFGQTRQTS